MSKLQLVIGRRTYPPVKIPSGCTVARWKELIGSGSLGGRVLGASRLVCFADGNSRVLAEGDVLPTAPEEVHIEGPTSVLGALTIALGGGSADHRPPAKPVKRRSSPERSFFQSGLRNPYVGGRERLTLKGDDTTSTYDRASAEAILDFWFGELTQEDWPRPSHFIDDTIRREFGSLHRRAVQGELAGWKARPETCLALVVMLDQFSRRLYRGTAAAYSTDKLAREAASVALIRGDDMLHWPRGSRRCALYLPFIHSDDIAELKRLFAALGARDSEPTGTNSTEELQRALGVAAAAMGRSQTPGDEEGIVAVLDEESLLLTLAKSSVRDESIALPQLRRAGRHYEGFRRMLTDAECWDVTMSSESNLSEDEDGLPTPSEAGSSCRPVSSQSSLVQISGAMPTLPDGPRQSGSRRALLSISARVAAPSSVSKQPRAARLAATAPSGPTLSEEIAGSYPVQVALELPKIQPLTQNDEFGRQFRAVKLDKKTQQAYERDKMALNIATNYQCMVCSDRHDFVLQTGRSGC